MNIFKRNKSSVLSRKVGLYSYVRLVSLQDLSRMNIPNSLITKLKAQLGSIHQVIYIGGCRHCYHPCGENKRWMIEINKELYSIPCFYNYEVVDKPPLMW